MAEVGIVSFNCCLSICPPLRFNGAFPRAARLADALYASIPQEQIDVICFQELVVQYNPILNSLIHHPHHTQPIASSLFGDNIRILHAGLATATRWPILEEDGHVFTGPSYNAEAFMAKAVQYTKIAVRGGKQVLHVFNTHLQAWTTPRACEIREEQTLQMAHFMQKKVSQSAFNNNELALVVGDFNLDDFENREHMDKLMRILQCQFLRPSTPQFSFDPSTNPLVGNDDATEYATRSKQNGCYEEFLQTGICSCCPRQLIDVVAVHNQSLFHIQNFETNVIPVKSRSDFDIHIDARHRRTVRTVSDHYAIFARLHLSTACETKTKPIPVCAKRRNKYCKKVHLGWIVFEMALFLLLFLVIFLLFRLAGSRILR